MVYYCSLLLPSLVSPVVVERVAIVNEYCPSALRDLQKASLLTMMKDTE